MAMGVPLICNDGVGDTAEIVKKYKAGIVINEFSDAVYQRALPEKENFDISEITKGANEYFSLNEGVKRYLHVYEAVEA